MLEYRPEVLVDQYFTDREDDFKKHPKLSNVDQRRNLLKYMHDIFGRRAVLFCIDVEAWERNTKIVTEIGISIFDPRGQLSSMSPDIRNYHIRPKENLNRLNGRFVPNNAQRFCGGTTHVMTMAHCVEFIQHLITKYFEGDLPCYLVGHDLRGDVQWFTTMGVKLPEDVLKLDTQKLIGLSTSSQTSLGNALHHLKIPHGNLHNAGNDAFYTLLLAIKLCDPWARLAFQLDTLYPQKVVRMPKGQTLQQHITSVEEMVSLIDAPIEVIENS